jgi:hypothetical protein
MASSPSEFALEVKEPGGSVCSSQFRLTPGGGTLLGGDLKQLNRLAYVAARAFSGEYEVTLRHLWGHPLGNSVRVEVVTHQGTARTSRKLETVAVGQRHTLKVRLDDGRRTSPMPVPAPGVEDADAREQAAPKSSYRILQMLRKIADEDFSGYNGGFQATVGSPLAARVQPALRTSEEQSERLALQTAITSPSGLSLTAKATVSDDRQTVRVSLVPNFNAVGAPQSAVIDLPLIPGGTAR